MNGPFVKVYAVSFLCLKKYHKIKFDKLNTKVILDQKILSGFNYID